MTFQDKVQDVLVLSATGVLGLNIFNIVYNQINPESTFSFGATLYLLAIGLILFVVLSFIRKTTQPLTKLQRDDWIIFAISIILTIAFLFYVPTLLPGIFSSASTDIASVAGVA